MGNVSQTIDNGNYDIGVYTYADLVITLINYNGLFNDDTQSSSMFYFTRDRAKVRVEYQDQAGGTNIVFNGIINDEATLQDFAKDTIKIRVLSRDSILRKTKVAGGVISDGSSISTALQALLNRPAITNVMGYDASKISVGYDAVIDDATPFSEKDTRNVLESLLAASGSVFYIDSENDMVVATRAVNTEALLLLENGEGAILLEDDITPIGLETNNISLKLYGGGDPFQRDNIVSIKNYNTGLQRTFNTITVNDETATDDIYVDRYGIGLKTYSFDFITSTLTHLAIAEYYLGQFKAPKNELEVIVKADVAKNVGILDPVTVSFKPRHKSFNRHRVPLAGVAIAGSDYAPYIIGGLKINDNKNWKIIGISQDTKSFLTTLRLREV